jgi:DNA-binding beta-propeller fold protein YncE
LEAALTNPVAFPLWVTNFAGNSITELNASNGSLVRVTNAAADGFNSPGVVAVGGTRVWVANSLGNSVTELNASNGSLVRAIRQLQCQSGCVLLRRVSKVN